MTGGPSTYDPDLYNKQREKLLKILPTDQSQLPPRRMKDSFDAAIIPIASDPSLRVRCLGQSVSPSASPAAGPLPGGRRRGEDRTTAGGHGHLRRTSRFVTVLHYCTVLNFVPVFQHVLNPLQPPGSASPFCIVTALVDQIDFTGTIRSDCDIRMSGHVTYVGKTSAESTLHLEQLIDGSWVKVTEATFVLVARDPLNRGAAFINPLDLVTEEEKQIFQTGAMNKKR